MMYTQHIIIFQHKILIFHNTLLYIAIYLITMIFIPILAHHTTLAYYAYKSKVYFLRNAMMIFCSLIIITSHTHTQIYKETNKKKFFFFSRSTWRNFWLHVVSHTSRRQPQIYHTAYVSSYTHILNIIHTSANIKICTKF